jgi:hypothetical protein
MVRDVRRTAMIMLALLAVVGSVAACGKPQPLVSFFAAGHATNTLPVQYCNAQLTTCYTADGHSATLRVPAGSPLQISVAPEVASSAWVVVFKYTQPDGTVGQDRSPVFAANTQDAYTLRMPTPSDQLTLAQVQQIGAITMNANDTAPDYQAVKVWSLTATS